MLSKGAAAQADFFETIAEEAIMGIIAFHITDKHCVYLNTLAREILELDMNLNLREFKIDDLKPKNPRANIRNFSDEMLEFEGLVRDVLLEKSNGIPFVADLGIKIIEETDTILLMVQDVTVQKKMQRELTEKQKEINAAYQELIVQNKQLKELDLAKDKFMALTTHELRTPLAAIVATSEVLSMKLYDDDIQRDEFINTVHEQSQALMALVNDILDFTKIQAGKMEFYIQNEDIHKALELTVTNFEQMAESYKVKINYLPMTTPALCYFDSVKIGEVFSNVTSNAVKFSKEGGEIAIAVEEIENHVRVTIADQGQGIKPEHIEKVFNEFETIGNIKTHHKGTGLGMPISKRLMDSMGGQISLESEFGVGTKFFIDIPKDKILHESNYKDRPDEIDDLLTTV